MRCIDVVELMTDYLEGTLAEEDRVRFEEHISGCDGCRAYLEQLRVTLRVLHDGPDVPVPEHIERELIEAFRDWRRTQA